MANEKRARLTLKPTEQGWTIVEGDRARLMTLPTKDEAEAVMSHLEMYLTDLVHRERSICLSRFRRRSYEAIKEVEGEIDCGSYPVP